MLIGLTPKHTIYCDNSALITTFLKRHPGESRDPPFNRSESGQVGPGFRRDTVICFGARDLP